jgi:molecular chaperone GrpE
VSKLTQETNNTINEEIQTEETVVELTEEQQEDNVVTEEKATAANEVNSNNEYVKEIEVLKSKLEEADNRYIRLQADFDNFRRRTRLDTAANEKYRAQKLITDLLPAIDNFERALKMEADNDQTRVLLQGMEMVYRNLVEALKNEGVEPIEAAGKEFDPHLHQAVMQVEDANFGPNIIVEEFQKGYMLKDRVIRPSMVKVNQ